MTTFKELYATFDPDAGIRGKQFERFVKWFLKNDPLWSSDIEKIWLWKEYPEKWGPDCSIDLVFKHTNGETWAVQAKQTNQDTPNSRQIYLKYLNLIVILNCYRRKFSFQYKNILKKSSLFP